MRPISAPLLLAAAFSLGGNAVAATRVSYGDGPSQPAQPKQKIYKYMDNGVPSFSDVAPAKGAYVVWSASCYACSLTSNIDWHSTKLHLQEFSDAIKAASQKYEVDPALVRAIIHAESNFNIRARSRKGAIGLMQLMPSTARVVGVDARVPERNIRGGVQYLSTLLTQFKGNVKLAIAAYNAGPAAVQKYGGVPPFAETQAYVERVGILHQRYKTYSSEYQ